MSDIVFFFLVVCSAVVCRRVCSIMSQNYGWMIIFGNLVLNVILQLLHQL